MDVRANGEMGEGGAEGRKKKRDGKKRGIDERNERKKEENGVGLS